MEEGKGREDILGRRKLMECPEVRINKQSSGNRVGTWAA